MGKLKYTTTIRWINDLLGLLFKSTIWKILLFDSEMVMQLVGEGECDSSCSCQAHALLLNLEDCLLSCTENTECRSAQWNGTECQHCTSTCDEFLPNDADFCFKRIGLNRNVMMWQKVVFFVMSFWRLPYWRSSIVQISFQICRGDIWPMLIRN